MFRSKGKLLRRSECRSFCQVLRAGTTSSLCCRHFCSYDSKHSIQEGSPTKVLLVTEHSTGHRERIYFHDASAGQPSVKSFLVKTNEQADQGTAWADVVKSLFLPEGYPHSVGETYWGFHKWELLKNIVSSASYVISTKALLTAVGLGAGAIPTAAAISWVLKDGLGCMGMILFARYLGSHFDIETKRMRWSSDFLNIAGVALELCTPLFPAYFLPLASIANAAKGMAGLTNGATRASINMSFVRKNNLGDITAKAHSQGLGAYLAGMGLGVGLTLAFEDASVSGLFAAFGALALGQLFFSFRALRAVRLPTLNPERLEIVLQQYLSPRAVAPDAAIAPFDTQNFQLKVPRPLEVIDRIILPLSPAVLLGVPIEKALGKRMDILPRLLTEFADRPYILWTHLSATQASHSDVKIHAIIRKEATSQDVLLAALHGYYLHVLYKQGYIENEAHLLSILPQTAAICSQLLPNFLSSLSDAGWNTSTLLLPLQATATWTA